MNPFRAFLSWPAVFLMEYGFIDRHRARRIVDLSWPRMITGFARISQEVADFAMIGTALGPTAVAGMAFAAAYWMVGNTLSLGLSGGTISRVSQEYGAGSIREVDNIIKNSLVLALIIASSIGSVYLLSTEFFIELLSGDPAAIGYGVVYLQIMSFGLVFEFVNKIMSRALVGTSDATTPMIIRGTGAMLNVILNAVFIFALQLGVFGAGLGTVLATFYVTVAFGIVLTTDAGERYFSVPFQLRVALPSIDTAEMRSIIGISAPLMLRRLSQTVAVFPFLAMASVYGTVIVAGFEVARRIRRLISAPSWGFSLATSSLVGQELGTGNRRSALSYGWDATWLSLFVHIITAALIFVIARPVGSVFVNNPAELDRIIPLIRIASVGVVGLGLDSVMTGIFRGSGNTRWPFYAKFAGLYFFTLPIVYVGTVTPLGINGLYLGLFAETTVAGVILFIWFLRSNAGIKE